MTEQPRLHVLGFEGLSQERVGDEVDLAHREVVGCPPIGVKEIDLLVRERPSGRRGGRRLAGVSCHLIRHRCLLSVQLEERPLRASAPLSTTLWSARQVLRAR